MQYISCHPALFIFSVDGRMRRRNLRLNPLRQGELLCRGGWNSMKFMEELLPILVRNTNNIRNIRDSPNSVTMVADPLQLDSTLFDPRLL